MCRALTSARLCPPHLRIAREQFEDGARRQEEYGETSFTVFFLAIIAEGSHPFPYRTRSLSPPAPMILGSPGKVGRCQDFGPHVLTDLGAFFFVRLSAAFHVAGLAAGAQTPAKGFGYLLPVREDRSGFFVFGFFEPKTSAVALAQVDCMKHCRADQ